MSQNSQHNSQQAQSNCPLTFKTFLSILVCIGLIIFFAYLQVNVINGFNITINDFSACQLTGELIRIQRTQAYNTVIMGLSVTAFIVQFGIAVFLIVISCKTQGYCLKQTQQQPQNQIEFDITNFQQTLKQAMKSHISQPKSLLQAKSPTTVVTPIQQANNQLHKPSSVYIVIQKQSIETYQSCCQSCCECQSAIQCVQNCSKYIFTTIYCRTCFDAHKFYFYQNKRHEQYFWVAKMISTLASSMTLAYVVRTIGVFNTLSYCRSTNTNDFYDHTYNLMIIAIILVVIDLFSYTYLFVEGTLFEKQPPQHKQKQNRNQLNENNQQHQQQDSDSDNEEHQEEQNIENLQARQSRHQIPTHTKPTPLFKQFAQPTSTAKNQMYMIKLKTLSNISRPRQNSLQQIDLKQIKQSQIKINLPKESIGQIRNGDKNIDQIRNGNNKKQAYGMYKRNSNNNQ